MTSGGVANAAGPAADERAASADANDNGNGGVGNGAGNGNAKHQDPAPDPVVASDSADHSDGTAGTSGDVSEPQPPSNADQNPGGANGDQCSTDPGATYCSTRDGSPSQNGNGKGEAKGKPCAGCVGKADNKNPPGQEKTDPMGTFPNNGYECDKNHGIGRGNPAHTGCQGTTPECDATVEDCDGGDGECDATVEDCDGGEGECDATVEDCDGGEDSDCVPTEANNFCSEVEGNNHHRNNEPPVVVEGERTVRTPQALPFTGDSSALLLGIAGLMLALGGGLVLAGRRTGRVTV